jgi:hypothetical protein
MLRASSADRRSSKPGGDVQEIAAWLERIGLGQYAQRFAENEIDVSVLP